MEWSSRENMELFDVPMLFCNQMKQRWSRITEIDYKHKRIKQPNGNTNDWLVWSHLSLSTTCIFAKINHLSSRRSFSAFCLFISLVIHHIIHILIITRIIVPFCFVFVVLPVHQHILILITFIHHRILIHRCQ